MCEPLIGCEDNDYWDAPLFYKSYVKSAVNFYRKYRNHPERFYEDQQESYKRMCKFVKGRICAPGTFGMYEIAYQYNDWLFDFAFSDVIE